METHPFMGLECTGNLRHGGSANTRITGMFAGFRDGEAYMIHTSGSLHQVYYGSLQFKSFEQVERRLHLWSEPTVKVS